MPQILIDPNQVDGLMSALTAQKNSLQNTASTLAQIQSDLDMQISASGSIDASFNALKKRINKQIERLNQYVAFLRTVNDRFTDSDKKITKEAKGINYLLNQMTAAPSISNAPSLEMQQKSEFVGKASDLFSTNHTSGDGLSLLGGGVLIGWIGSFFGGGNNGSGKTSGEQSSSGGGRDSSNRQNEVPVESVSITGNKTIKQNKKATLKAVIVPANATNKKVTWSTKDKKIISIDKNTGEIKGVASGETEITVTTDDGKKTAKLAIKVTDEGWIYPIKGNAGNANTHVVGCQCGGHGRYPHNGQDYGGCSGKTVVAVRSGKIIKRVATDNGGYGVHLKIEHVMPSGKKGHSLYAHLKQGSLTALKVGDKIEKGAKVGTVGNTGFSGGAHLHLELFVGKKCLDPKKYCKK